jgi:hypothetical protein
MFATSCWDHPWFYTINKFQYFLVIIGSIIGLSYEIWHVVGRFLTN